MDRGKTAILLIVEDDPLGARSLGRLLVDRPEAVTVASTLAAARAIPLGEVRAIFLDIGLPDGDGLDFLEETRAAGNDLPVAVVTGTMDSGSINRAQRLGAEFIAKPYESESVRAFLRRADARTDVTRWTHRLAHPEKLSTAEAAIVEHAVNGLSLRSIARVRGVSLNTVKSQIRSILKKTGYPSLQRLVLDLARTPPGTD